MKLRRFFAVLLAGAVLLTGQLLRPADRAKAADPAAYAAQVAELVNSERAAYGLAPLTYSAALSRPAQVRAQEIQSVFSHTRPNGQSCFSALSEAGIRYTYAGENIAYGQRSPQEVMDAWMHSEGHRANILNARVTHIGVGVTVRNGVYYWSQFFAASEMLEPVTTTATTTTTTIKTTTTTTTTTTATAPASHTAQTETVTTVTTAPPAPAETPACGWQTVLARLCEMLGLDCNFQAGGGRQQIFGTSPF